MSDIVDKETRSRMMAGIKGKNTKPELVIRKAIFNRGFRYRIHEKKLPGKPDIVLKKYKAVIFIHGCFWHKHNCHLFKWPKSNPNFWKKKISTNKKNDLQNINKLIESGWRITIIWECSLKGKGKPDFEELITKLCDWIESSEERLEITGCL